MRDSSPSPLCACTRGVKISRGTRACVKMHRCTIRRCTYGVETLMCLCASNQAHYLLFPFTSSGTADHIQRFALGFTCFVQHVSLANAWAVDGLGTVHVVHSVLARSDKGCAATRFCYASLKGEAFFGCSKENFGLSVRQSIQPP